MEKDTIKPVNKLLEHNIVLKREDFIDDLSFNAVMSQIFGSVSNRVTNKVHTIKLAVCGATADDK